MKTFKLRGGMVLPGIGFGTYNPRKQNMTALVETALACGCRFIDTASLYETERAVGEAIRRAGIARYDLIIESKLWYDERGYEGAKEAVERSLSRLGTDYIDLMLIHWPRATGEQDEDWKSLDLETWRALEDMVREGKIREIGCSNFLPVHLENIIRNAEILPSVDQLELHIGYTQEAAVEYCRAHGIQPMAWGPLGRGKMGDYPGRSFVLHLAEKYGKSEQQIFLRFLLQRDILPIPKATGETHIRANLEVFDFDLTDEEMWMLRCMPQTSWMGEHPDFSIPQKQSKLDQ